MTQWIEDQPLQMASTLVYYTTFSLAPLLIIVIAITGDGLWPGGGRGANCWDNRRVIGRQSAEAVQGVIQSASSQRLLLDVRVA